MAAGCPNCAGMQKKMDAMAAKMSANDNDADDVAPTSLSSPQSINQMPTMASPAPQAKKDLLATKKVPNRVDSALSKLRSRN